MTRPDAMSEPSMEDILASIRRIIAEDPPGSRPAPAPVSTATSSTSIPAPSSTAAPAPLRQMQMRDAALFDKPSPGSPSFDAPSFETPARESQPEPASYEPQLPRPSSPDPFLKADPAFTTAFPAPSRPMPRYQVPSRPTENQRLEPLPAATIFDHVPSRAEAPVQAPVANPALSIDDQLSDLLDDVAPPSANAAAPAEASSRPADTQAPVFAPAAQAPSQPDFSALGRMTTQLPSPRPGFTVSRIGFTGDEPAEPAATFANKPAPASSPAAFDPFEFDLGPSPFARGKDSEPAVPAPAPAAAEPSTAPSSSTGRSTFAADIDALIAEVSSKTAASVVTAAAPAIEDVPVDAPAVEASAVEVPAIEEIGAEPAEPVEPAAELASPAADEAELEPVVDASAAETEPVVQAPAIEAATLQDEGAASAQTISSAPATDAPFKTHDRPRDILPLAPAPEPFETAVAAMPTANAPSIRSLAQTEYLSAAPASSVPATYEMPASQFPVQRTAEDALAELLRPMLRTWLAENMPKIVERALRQELSAHTDQKTAAE